MLMIRWGGGGGGNNLLEMPSPTKIMETIYIWKYLKNDWKFQAICKELILSGNLYIA